ncbi:hypothetical protein NAI42_11360, partial [Francisella tularensis subsp. holarctica]|uniref:hypothetical protein n=1 Tax=Francisella tularensis TaxID=263 RepID=UPI002381CE30
KLQTQDVLAKLFAEEVGVVIQFRNSDVSLVEEMFKDTQIHLCAIAKINSSDELNIFANGEKIYSITRVNLQSWWAETSYK